MGRSTALLTRTSSTNLIIILGFMQISKKVPFDDPNVLNGVRALYVVSNIIIASIYFYVQTQINKKNGTCCTPLCARSPFIHEAHRADAPPQT